MSRIFKSLIAPAGLALWRNRGRIQTMLADRKTGPESQTAPVNRAEQPV